MLLLQHVCVCVLYVLVFCVTDISVSTLINNKDTKTEQIPKTKTLVSLKWFHLTSGVYWLGVWNLG